jgi:ketosteroid isomerase-like protein
MSANQQLLTTFYTAFQKKDYEAMAGCYHPQVVFNDAVFTNLVGWRACAMWRMLCERGKDLEVTFSDVQANDSTGSARWEARYTFSGSGLPVHNKISATFEFADGKIRKHTDEFDLRAWMAMALGAKGKMLGWLPPMQNAVKAKAMKSLQDYIHRNNLIDNERQD